jgi:hypothetical protein
MLFNLVVNMILLFIFLRKICVPIFGHDTELLTN